MPVRGAWHWRIAQQVETEQFWRVRLRSPEERPGAAGRNHFVRSNADCGRAGRISSGAGCSVDDVRGDSQGDALVISAVCVRGHGRGVHCIGGPVLHTCCLREHFGCGAVKADRRAVLLGRASSRPDRGKGAFFRRLLEGLAVKLVTCLSGKSGRSTGHRRFCNLARCSGHAEPDRNRRRRGPGKAGLTPTEALFRGVLCNLLNCLAVWMSFAAHFVSGKVLMRLLPISAFVAVGFEHAVANMNVVPVAMLGGLTEPDLDGFLRNIAIATTGNVIGGGSWSGRYTGVFSRQSKPGLHCRQMIRICM